MKQVWISWDDGEPVLYEFPTEAEVNAFLRGVMEAAGEIRQYEQFDSLDEYKAKYQVPA